VSPNRLLQSEAERYRLAWQSARRRAATYGSAFSTVEFVVDERDDILTAAQRYRLAWLHARERARGQRVRAEYAEEEREGLRQALNDWIADSDDDRVAIARQVRDRALLRSYSLRDELDDVRHEYAVLLGIHKDLDERYVLALTDHTQALGERDEARAEVVRLGRELEAWRASANDMVRSLPKTPGGGDPS
jgi:hypothetical protein